MGALSDDPAKSSVVLDREPDQAKSLDPSGPRIRCPLCGWLPRRDDRWSCTCGHSWNTFETGGVCPACLHQWTNPVPFLYPLVATFRLVCAVTKSRMTEHGGSIQSRARLQEVRGCPM